MARQALHSCPRGKGHVHPHLPDPRQLPQHQAIHSCLSRERAAAPGADVPAVGDPWEGGAAQSQVLPVAPALQGEHELTRSWDTCPTCWAGLEDRTAEMLLCHPPGSCVTCWHGRRNQRSLERLWQPSASSILGMMSHVTALIGFVCFEVTGHRDIAGAAYGANSLGSWVSLPVSTCWNAAGGGSPLEKPKTSVLE